MEVEASYNMIIGAILIFHQHFSTLFNLSSIYSYMYFYYISRMCISSEPMEMLLHVLTPMDESLLVDHVF